MEVLEFEGGVPIYNWARGIENDAMKQASNLSRLNFAYHHIALMADCHVGYGMPIGGVLAAKGFIIPNAVGVDIGCGVLAVKSDFRGELDRDVLANIIGGIRKRIPVGFKRNKEGDLRVIDELLKKHKMSKDSVCFHERKMSSISIGTLGGGNHFIDFLRDEEGFLWIMVHSGSRNLGKKVCDFYNSVAKVSGQGSGVRGQDDLAALSAESFEGKSYLKEMGFCLEFAFLNRKRMMAICLEEVSNIIEGVKFEEEINIHHNYANKEVHFGEEVWVHRKGATSARKGELGVVPGSQGTSSYIVRGLGNKDSFESCAHGAGRKISRKKAIDTLDLEEEKRKLEEKGILHGIRGKRDLDEAESVYKDIDEVMRLQSDLVEIVEKLEPIGILKG